MKEIIILTQGSKGKRRERNYGFKNLPLIKTNKLIININLKKYFEVKKSFGIRQVISFMPSSYYF